MSDVADTNPAPEVTPPAEEPAAEEIKATEEEAVVEDAAADDEAEAEPEVIEALERRQTLASTTKTEDTTNDTNEVLAIVLKEGELTKQGGSVKSWKKRYFVLTPDSLAYYTKKNGAVKGGILLETATNVRTADAADCKGKQFCFVIETPDRNYVQQAASQEDADAWIKVVDEVLVELKKSGGPTAIPATEGEGDEAPAAADDASAAEKAEGGDAAPAASTEDAAAAGDNDKKEKASITIVYWPFLGRSNAAQRMLREAGIEFEFKSEFADVAASAAAFGTPTDVFAPPILQDGDFTISQSTLINRYVGEKCGFVPESKADAYKCNQYMLDIIDLFEREIGTKNEDGEKFKTFLYGDGSDKPSRFTTISSMIESQIQGPYFFGEKLTYVDFGLTAVMDWTEYQTAAPLQEKTGKDMFEKCPKMKACVEKVRALESFKANELAVGRDDFKLKAEVLAAFE